MAGRVAGICFVKADGQQFEIKGGLELPLMATSREAVMGVSGLSGYKEMAQRQFVKITAIFVNSFPINLFRSSTNMTVVVETPNGKSFTLTGAYLEGEPVANDEGEIELEFSGTKGIWR